MYLSYNSDMGRVRNENQDKICAGFLSENAALAVVCDGMGGEASGSVASDLAANQIYRRISEGYQQAQFDGHRCAGCKLDSLRKKLRGH